MAVLKTTSPVVLPVAPIDVPLKIVPSARAKMAGAVKKRVDEKKGRLIKSYPPHVCSLVT